MGKSQSFSVLAHEWLESGDRGDSKSEYYNDLRDAIETLGDSILLGEPGAGKTTTLWRLMFDYAQRARTEPSSILPVLINLGRYDGKSNLVDFIRDELILDSKRDSETYPAHRRLALHLNEYLTSGRLLLLFDALNEMPEGTLAQSIEHLERFRQRNSGNRFIFSCRLSDYTVPLNVARVEIQDLDQESQRKFLKMYFGEEGEKLFQTLLYPDTELLELGRNPYMLLMIGQVYQLEGGVPSNRGRLVRAFVRTLFERERRGHPERPMDAEAVSSFLSVLGLAIHRHYGWGTTVPAEWVRQVLTDHIRNDWEDAQRDPSAPLSVARGASLIVESPDGSIRFSHQLLQEYFAALALQGSGTPIDKEYVLYSKWDEVIVLLAGLQDDATPLVELLTPIDPFLAARCAGVGTSLRLSAKLRLASILASRLKSQFQRERIMAIRALCLMRTREVDLVCLLKSKDRESRAEAVLALGQYDASVVLPHLVPLLSHRSSHVRETALRTIGRGKYQAGIRHLIKALADKNPVVRWEAVRSLKAFGDLPLPYLLPVLKQKEPSARMAAVRALEDIQDKSSVPSLIALLEDKDTEVRTEAALGLGRLDAEEAVPELLLLLWDEKTSVRLAALQSLGKIRATKTAPLIVVLLSDGDPEVRGAALNAFRESGLDASTLFPLLQHPSPQVRSSIAWALGELKDDLAIGPLRPLLKDKLSFVRGAAAWSLGQLQDRRSIGLLTPLLRGDSDEAYGAAWAVGELRAKTLAPILLPLLKRREASIRCASLWAIAASGVKSCAPSLLPLLRDEDPLVRYYAAWAVHSLRAKAAIPQLRGLLHDSDARVREESGSALFEIMGPASIPLVLPLIGDEERSVYKLPERALSHVRAERTIPHILPLLRSKDPDVRYQATWALGYLANMEGRSVGVRRARSQLLSLLNDSHAGVRWAAAWSLNSLDSREVILNLLPLLDDVDPMVQSEVARGLGEFGTENELPTLRPLLRAKDARVRDSAFESIRSIQRRLNLPKDYVIKPN